VFPPMRPVSGRLTVGRAENTLGPTRMEDEMISTRLRRAMAPRIWMAATAVIAVACLGGLGRHAAAAATTHATATPADARAAATPSFRQVPIYRPSRVISKGPQSRQLVSRSSVSKIAAFYKRALSRNGWHRRYSSISPFNASVGAHRAGEGVTVSIFNRQGGSGISIATHPE
jgi:hypothetical protein